LQLPGAAPAPRRGHAAAPAGPWGGIIFSGGRSELKSLLGIKKSEYLMDVVLLQRQMDALKWMAVEPAMSGGAGGEREMPVAREKHTLCALKDGRFFLYGGEFYYYFLIIYLGIWIVQNIEWFSPSQHHFTPHADFFLSGCGAIQVAYIKHQ
jgi:hypothetical protein